MKRSIVEFLPIELVERGTITFLPTELLCLVGDELEVEALFSLTLVCQLFRDVFFPLYLVRRGFLPSRRFVHLQSCQDFKSFQSFHRFRDLPSGAHLSATFSRGVNPDSVVRALTYTLSHLSPGTFTSIYVNFARHPTGAQPLAHLFAALVLSRCTYLHLTSCFVREDMVDIPRPSLPVEPWPLDQLLLDGRLNNPLFSLLVHRASQSLENITLARSSITDTNCAASVQTWDRVLSVRTFPQLTTLKLSEDIPLKQLLDFISHHSHLCRLSITREPGFTCLMDGIGSFYDLMSLTAISGPPSYVLAILRSASCRLSLERLSLLVDDLPPSSIIPTIIPCLTLCQQVETLEVAIPDRDCQAIFNNITFEYDTIPNIKVLRTAFPKFSLDPPNQDADIIVHFFHDGIDSADMTGQALWREWHLRLRTIEHLQLDQSSHYHDRKTLFETACEEFPTLGVSVRWGSYLMENDLAVRSGGFDWHVLE
jgi:hypothetical protein